VFLAVKFTEAQINKMLVGKGGISAYLGTNNAKEVSDRAKAGDEKAGLIYSAMAYQVAKAIGEYAVVLDGDVDASFSNRRNSLRQRFCKDD